MIFSTLLLPFDKWFLANALPFMHAWLANLTTIWFSNFLHIYYCLDIWLWLINFFVLQKWTCFVLARSFQHCSSTVKRPKWQLSDVSLSHASTKISFNLYFYEVWTQTRNLKQIKEYLVNLLCQMTLFVDFNHQT